MTRTIGYTRPLLEDDAAAETAALRAAGATFVFVEAATVAPGEVSELDRCLEELTSGDVLVVTGTARLASSVTGFTRRVAVLGERGVRFRSLQEPVLSTDGPPVEPARVMAALEALRGELASLRARKRPAGPEGRRRGRPSVMTPERIAMALELRRHHRSLAHIADVLGVSASAVQRALAHPADHTAR